MNGDGENYRASQTSDRVKEVIEKNKSKFNQQQMSQQVEFTATIKQKVNIMSNTSSPMGDLASEESPIDDNEAYHASGNQPEDDGDTVENNKDSNVPDTSDNAGGGDTETYSVGSGAEAPDNGRVAVDNQGTTEPAHGEVGADNSDSSEQSGSDVDNGDDEHYSASGNDEEGSDESSTDSQEDHGGGENNSSEGDANQSESGDSPSKDENGDSKQENGDQDKAEGENANAGNDKKEDNGENSKDENKDSANNGENKDNNGEKPSEDAAKDQANAEKNGDDDAYKAKDNSNDNQPKNPNDAEQNQNPKSNPNNQTNNQRGPQNEKQDGAKDRVDKAKEKGKQKGAGKDAANGGATGNNNQENKDNKGKGEESDKKDKPDDKKDGGKGNDKDGKGKPSIDPRKKAEEARKKKIEAGKKAIKEGRATSKEALQYAAIKPGEYAKDVARQKLKTLFMKHPIVCCIIVGAIFITFISFMSLYGMSGGSNGKPNFNRYDYTYVKVQLKDRVTDSELTLHDGVVGAAYAMFFINDDNKIYNRGLSKTQMENIFAMFYLYTKTTLLKSPRDDKYHFNPSDDKYEYIVKIKSGSNPDWPTFCDPYLGCNDSFWDYVTCESDDEDCQYKGLNSYDEGTKAREAADILLDVTNHLYDYTAAPADLKGVITNVDNSFGVDSMSETKYNNIINFAVNYSRCLKSIYTNDKVDVNYLNNMLSIFQGGSESENVCVAAESSVQAYNVRDYIIDENVAYQDIGFWWPIGSDEITTSTDENGKTIQFASGEPHSAHISSYFVGDRTVYVDGKEHTGKHEGIDLDYVQENQTPVIAVYGGTVKAVTCNTGNIEEFCGNGKYKYNNKNLIGGGCYIVIDHENGMQTVYMHLPVSSFDSYVKYGQKVSRGQVIAKVGNTGCSTGAHLHFGIKVDGVYINPLNYVSENFTRSSRPDKSE